MTYSKSQVNRAGQLLVDQVRAAADGEQRVGLQRAELTAAIETIDWWRSEHAMPLLRVMANLHHYVKLEGEPAVAQRLKKLPTIVGKLIRTPGMKLARMEDVGGVRAVLPTQEAAYRVAVQLRRNWTITRVRDYVAEPKSDGYRALHLINRNRGRLIEVQLRTRLQDAWANSVEIDARRFAPQLKFGGGPRDLRDFYRTTADFLAIADQGLPADPVLYRRLMELRDRVDTLRKEAHEPR